MLNAQDRKRLAKLNLHAAVRAPGQQDGSHRSWRTGGGVEFHAYRPYSPGDDTGRIDWKRYARTDRWYIRQSPAPSDINAYILLDHTASMDYPNPSTNNNPSSAATNKLRYAATLAAALAYTGLQQSDRVGMGTYAHEVTDHLPPRRDRSQLDRILRILDKLSTQPSSAATAQSIRQAHDTMRARGLLIVISDFLDGLDATIGALANVKSARFDVALLQVLSREELDLQGIPQGVSCITDPDTQQSRLVNLRPATYNYKSKLQNHLAAIRRGCQRVGAGYKLLITQTPPITGLIDFLTHQQHRIAHRAPTGTGTTIPSSK